MELKVKGRIVLIDKEDFSYISQFKWGFTSAKPSRSYALRYFRNGENKVRSILMHREILNAPKGLEVDHINGNTLDNRKQNLRLCSRIENSRNHKINVNNTSGVTGVHWDSFAKAWRAVITINNKDIPLGRFKSKELAIATRRRVEFEVFGEFVRQKQC